MSLVKEDSVYTVDKTTRARQLQLLQKLKDGSAVDSEVKEALAMVLELSMANSPVAR